MTRQDPGRAGAGEVAGLAEELVAAGRRIVAELAGRERLALVGVGWATVELARAARELTGALGPALELQFGPAPDDPTMGAYCEVGRLAGGAWLVLLEPNTEGRLAGCLVRFGEAAVVAYAARIPGRHALEGRDLAPAMPGPLGAARHVAGGRRGPHLLLLDDPGGRATIRP
jgi:hypothetical protein